MLHSPCESNFLLSHAVCPGSRWHSERLSSSIFWQGLWVCRLPVSNPVWWPQWVQTQVWILGVSFRFTFAVFGPTCHSGFNHICLFQLKRVSSQRVHQEQGREKDLPGEKSDPVASHYFNFFRFFQVKGILKQIRRFLHAAAAAQLHGNSFIYLFSTFIISWH